MSTPRPDLVARLLFSAALFVLTGLVFAQTIGHEFINYDDPSYVHDVPEITGGITARGIAWSFTSRHSGNWHPVTSMSHMLDCQLFGLDPSGHHFTNVLLHSLGVVLLFLALHQMTGALWRSGVAAALFAVHPLRVESVAWIAERKDVLSGVFFMLTLLAYVRYARRRTLFGYLILMLSFAFGLMSKPSLVPLPFLLLLLDFWPLRRTASARRLIIEKIPLLLLSAGSCLVTVLVQTATMSSLERLPIAWRLANACTSVAIYIGQLFCPVNLAVFYPHPRDQFSTVTALVALLVVVGMSVTAVRERHRRTYLLVGWFWFLGMLVPVIGLVQVGLQGHADRYTYLPHIGLALLATWGLAEVSASWPQRRVLLASAAALVLSALSWLSFRQGLHWRNSESLWRRNLAVTSRNAVAHTNLGNLLPGRDALPHYEAALAIDPDAIEPLNNLAWIFATCPDPGLRNGPRAVTLAEKAVQISGRSDPLYLRTLAAAYAETNRFSEATTVAREALALATKLRIVALANDLAGNIDGFKRRFPVRDASLAASEPPP